MKNALSILFAVLILVSGMHPYVSTHYCGGSIAAVKWSFNGENATCGMVEENQPITAGYVIKESCCQNETAVYSVDDKYTTSSFHYNLTPEFTSVMFTLPANLLVSAITESSLFLNKGSPPGSLLAGSVSLSGLCTFRI